MPRRRERGTAIIEFTFAGITAIFMVIGTVHLSIAMWNYHTLAYTVHQTTRFLAVKGVNCTKPGNTCSVTVGAIAKQIQAFAIGVSPDSLNVTLKTDSGAVTPCNPVTNCDADGTVWPPGTNNDNHVGSKVTVSATYHFQSPLLLFWPGKGTTKFGQVWLPAASTQRIIF